jgi:hypothetical protein
MKRDLIVTALASLCLFGCPANEEPKAAPKAEAKAPEVVSPAAEKPAAAPEQKPAEPAAAAPAEKAAEPAAK